MKINGVPCCIMAAEEEAVGHYQNVNRVRNQSHIAIKYQMAQLVGSFGDSMGFSALAQSLPLP